MRLPSLDTYDVQGLRPDEAAMWPDEVRQAAEDGDDLLWGFGLLDD